MKKISPIYNLQYTIYNKAFTLVELMIVVAILGIMAAIVLPEFQGHAQQAKEAAAKDSLRILRETFARFAAEHNDRAPGYLGNGFGPPHQSAVYTDMYSDNRRYFKTMPKNPFNNLATFLIVTDAQTMPASATGAYGWIYQPKTKDVRLDWPGTDSSGISFYSY